MEIKREAIVNGAGLVVARTVLCRGGFSKPLTEAVNVLHGLASGRRRDISPVWPPATALGGADVWETAGYLALWAGGLLGIGLCLL